MFYAKLALSNLRKNKQAYLPFLISMLFLVAINTMSQLIVKNPGMEALPDSTTALMMFGTGIVIIVIFSVIFSLYTNSFLLKQRKKELGLYNVLGLGKRELYQLMIWENFFSFIFVVISGLITGMILAKLGFLILSKLLGLETGFVFQVPFAAVLQVLLVFIGIFGLLLLINCLQIAKTDPIQLLHGGKKGEQMPKTRWFSAVAGVIALVVGYYLAITIDSPIEAFAKFFIAVILVVAGTYLLFQAGSIALLKMLKKRSHYYYQTNHFINVSTMIYRMKQNAAGLASICILSTMVLVTVATTACLFFGQKQMSESRYSHDLAITSKQVDGTTMEKTMKDFAQEQQVPLENQLLLKTTDSLLFTKGNDGDFHPMVADSYDMSKISSGVMLTFLDLTDYHVLSGKTAELAENEVLLLTLNGEIKGDQLHLEGRDYQIKERLQELPGMKPGEGLTDAYVVVMKDWDQIQGLLDKWYTSEGYQRYRLPVYTIAADFANGSEEDHLKFGAAFSQHLESLYGPQDYRTGYTFDDKVQQVQNNRQFTGGFFFLGLIFGVTFTLATALIIYYKQVSEGLEDQERFNILQKVGMSHQEVKKVITSQVLMVFAFPLAVAMVHLAFAFNMIRKLLILFGLTNWQLFFITCLVSALIFAVLYYLVYRLTAKTYYRLVERKA